MASSSRSIPSDKPSPITMATGQTISDRNPFQINSLSIIKLIRKEILLPSDLQMKNLRLLLFLVFSDSQKNLFLVKNCAFVFFVGLLKCEECCALRGLGNVLGSHNRLNLITNFLSRSQYAMGLNNGTFVPLLVRLRYFNRFCFFYPN